MIARKILLFIALCFAVLTSFAASNQPAKQTDIQQLQQQFQTLDKDVAAFKAGTDSRLTALGDRFSDLSSRSGNHLAAISNLTAYLSTFIGLVALVAGFATYFNSKQRAAEVAEETAKKWFEENSK